MNLTCIIVDDEIMSRQSLQRLCDQHPALLVGGSFSCASQALNYLAQHPVDLIWLDVEMPEQTGFDLLEQLPAIPFVVLTTSKVEYAFDAFQYQVTDYIRKPITLPRFKVAVEKVLDMARLTQTDTQPKHREIYVKSDGRYIRLPFDVITHVENMGDYVKIFTTSQTHVVHTTMKSLEEKLGPPFLRVHRSYIVHLDKIVDIEENTLVVQDKVIPISRASKPELMNRLNLL